MIVIASHNHADLTDKLLNSLCKINTNHKILVVDTNSDNPNYLDNIKNKYSNVIFERKNYTCWDSGAYLHAYLNYNESSYIFLQDSIEITNNLFISNIDKILLNFDVIGLNNFSFFYDNDEQKEYAEFGIKNLLKNYPLFGIFGPMFGVNKKILDRIPKSWFLEPDSKIKGCAMERRWALIFHILEVPVKFLEYIPNHEYSLPLDYNLKSSPTWKIFKRQFPGVQTNFKKIFLKRP